MKTKVTMPIITTLFILGSIIFIILPSLSIAQPQQLSRDKIAEKINAIIDEEVEKTDLTGATIAVYYKGSPLITRGIGYADEPNQVKVNEHTGFRIGSITKLFTAISIMKLVEDGVISLDDSIFKYLPDYQPKLLPGVNRDNRIRDLLTHHNGVPSFWLKDRYMKTPSLESLRQFPQVLSEDFLVENRREVHSYSNLAYALAGLIVERVSGQPYDEFIKEHFFEALEMNDSHVFLPDDRKKIALPHKEHQSQESLEFFAIPAGSIFVSALDMHPFMEMIIDTWHGDEDDIIEPKTLRRMAEYQNPGVTYDTTNFMGIGFFLDKKQGFTHLSHNGCVQIFISEFQIIPELKIGVFVSTNGSESGSFSWTVTNKIIDALLGANNIQKSKKKQIKTSPQSMKRIVAPSGDYILSDLYKGSILTTINHKSPTPYIILYEEKFLIEPFEPNGWKIIGCPWETLHKSCQHEGYYLKYGSYSENLMVLKKYPRSQNWDQFKGHIYSTHIVPWGKAYLRLDYKPSDQSYSTLFSIPDFPYEAKFIQHIISDTLLQVQGKGRNASLVTQFLDKNTVKFAGLTFTREKNSDHQRITDASINQPGNREEVINRLKSLFSSRHRSIF